MSNEEYWYLEGKNYLNIEMQGIELLKKYLVNADKLFQSELFHHELAYVIIKELGDKVNNITMMAYDENTNELYIVSGLEQYKFSLQNNVLCLNDFIIETSTIHIPEFTEEKIFIKE